MKLLTLFETIDQATVAAVAKQIARRYGVHLELRLNRDNIVDLEGIQAPKDAPPGTGTDAMRALVKWADHNGIFLTLQFGEKGYQPNPDWKKTSSKARLEKFYRRFGFKPNKGRYKRFDLSMYTNMYRDPQVVESFRDETTIPNVDDILADPEYFRTAKKKQARRVQMSPKEYIELAIKGFERYYEDKSPEEVRKMVLGSRSKSKAKEYAKAMQAGDKFPALSLDYTSGFSQEGLHRAIAAMMIGLETVPVVIVEPVN